VSTTGTDRWSGPCRKSEKGKLGWKRRIGQEEFMIFKILFFFPRLIQILK
jgi:hypothetical protein